MHVHIFSSMGRAVMTAWNASDQLGNESDHTVQSYPQWINTSLGCAILSYAQKSSTLASVL